MGQLLVVVVGDGGALPAHALGGLQPAGGGGEQARVGGRGRGAPGGRGGGGEREGVRRVEVVEDRTLGHKGRHAEPEVRLLVYEAVLACHKITIGQF